DFDNYGGVSGGVYALFGALISAGVVKRQLFPKGFWLLILNLTVLGIFASEVISENTASAAHAAGIFLGGEWASTTASSKRAVKFENHRPE
ncbi:rhomboid family intramembrane serine protease, partial [Xanthomonas theicola]